MVRQQTKRGIGWALTLTGVLLALALVFLVFSRANDLGVPLEGNISEFALVTAIVLGVIILILIVLLLLRQGQKKEKEVQDARPFFVPEEQEGDVEPVQETGGPTRVRASQGRSKALQVIGHEPLIDGLQIIDKQTVTFPKTTNSALYVRDPVEVAPGQQIVVRTLIAGLPLPLGDMADRWTVQQELDRQAAERRPVARREPVAPAPVLAARRDVGDDIDDLIARRETRTYVRRTVTPAPVAVEAPKADVYYQYRGDVHPVIEVEGIGEVYAERLQAMGVETTARLMFEDVDKMADAIKAKPGEVRNWQAMAELMMVNGIGPQYAELLVRAGVTSIQEFKKRSAAEMAKQVAAYVDQRKSTITGQPLTERRIARFQEAAKPMRRVRCKIPEN